MKSHLLKQPHYLNECIGLLSDHINGDTYETYIAESCKNMSLVREDIAPLFEAQIKMRDIILAELIDEHEKITYYFTSLDDKKLDHHSLASLLFAASSHIEVEPYAAELIALNDTERRQRIIQIIHAYFEDMESVDTLAESPYYPPGELERRILAKATSDAQKVKLLSLCLNFFDLVQELTPILKKAIATYKQNEHLVLPKFNELYTKLQHKMQQDGPNVLKRFIQLPEDDNCILFVVPSIMQAASGRYIANDKAEQFIFYGVNLDEILELRESKKGNEKKVSDILKILGDKTKQEILYALRYESLYGQALADKLGLSTATISYHLSLLLQHGFIHVNRENTRLYCTLNKEVLAAALEQVKSYFCN